MQTVYDDSCATGWMAWGSNATMSQEIYLFSRMSRPVLGPIQPAVHIVSYHTSYFYCESESIKAGVVVHNLTPNVHM